MVVLIDPLAVPADVEEDLGRPLTPAESGRVGSQLVKASALVVAYTNRNFENESVPSAVQAVTAGMVSRAISNIGQTANVEQQTAGPMSVRFAEGAKSDTPWLSSADKAILQPYRTGGGVRSIRLVKDVAAQ